MFKKPLFLLINCALCFMFSGSSSENVRMDDRDADRAAIRAHVDTIFQAYINKDAVKVRATHSDDWVGYFLGSRTLTQGIAGYMEVANNSLNNKNAGMTNYKLTEFNIVFHGNIALVFYVADIEGRVGDALIVDKYRSVDVYEKRNGEWIQVASHLARHPAEIERRQSSFTQVSQQMREQILQAREEVWRAWFTNDHAKLEKLIPDEAVAIDSASAQWEKRATILEGARKFAASGAKLVRLEFPRTDIQLYGSTIILYTRYLYETERDGKKTSHIGNGVETFVIRNGSLVNTGWLLASEK